MHCGYMDKRGQQCWKIMWQFLIKLSIHLPLTWQFHSWVFTQEKWKHVHTHKKSYKNVHCSLYFIMAISRRMVYSYNGIVFSNKKEGLTDIHNNMGESQKHYGKQKKPDTKEYIWCEVQEQILLMHVAGNKEVVAWEEGGIEKRQEEALGVMKCYISCSGSWLPKYIQLWKFTELHAWHLSVLLYSNYTSILKKRSIF